MAGTCLPMVIELAEPWQEVNQLILLVRFQKMERLVVDLVEVHRSPG